MKFLASDLLSNGFSDMRQINEAIDRAIQICLSSSTFSIKKNFKPVYISDNGNMLCDWKLSPIARKLVIVNADASIPIVAKIQFELLNI